jgi:hypothetical protein
VCIEALHNAFQFRKKCIEADGFFRSIASNEVPNGNLQYLEEINIKSEYCSEQLQDPDEIAQEKETKMFVEAPACDASSVKNTKDIEVSRKYQKKTKVLP